MDTLEFCQKYRIRNYKINSDGTIDVNGNVYLENELGDMEKLPVKFGKVYGEFWCSNNKLTTLEGCPNFISYTFMCDHNNLTTLEYSPKNVGDFDCGYNNLTTLKGIEDCKIRDDFLCMNNHNIPPEKYIFILTAKIDGGIFTDNKAIDNILNKYKNDLRSLYKALTELINVNI